MNQRSGAAIGDELAGARVVEAERALAVVVEHALDAGQPRERALRPRRRARGRRT